MALPLIASGETIGVVEFLNKIDGTFVDEDLEIASRLMGSLALKVQHFGSKDANYKILGLAPEIRGKEGAILIIDLSNSSSLLEVLPISLSVDTINEYLDIASRIAITRGATIDKFLGDGIILRFNVPQPLDAYSASAVRTAWEIRSEFQRLKKGWVDSGIPASGIFCRAAISSGRLFEAILGPPQFKQHSVIGEPVIIASNLCDNSRRDQDVILIDEATYQAAKELVNGKPHPLDRFHKAQQLTDSVYEIVGLKDES